MSKFNLNFNTIIVGGYLGRDSETKVTTSGNLVKFSVGTSRYAGKKDGKPEYVPNFHNIISFNLKDTTISKLKKGTAVIVDGTQVNSFYINKDGQRVNTSEIHANIVRVVSVSENVDSVNQPESNGATTETSPDVQVEGNEDLPF